MSSRDANRWDSGTVHTCPEGHLVGENDLFCPACLAVVPRAPGAYWTTNNGRDLHPSVAGDDTEKGAPVPLPGGYCHRRRH